MVASMPCKAAEFSNNILIFCGNYGHQAARLLSSVPLMSLLNILLIILSTQSMFISVKCCVIYCCALWGSQPAMKLPSPNHCASTVGCPKAAIRNHSISSLFPRHQGSYKFVQSLKPYYKNISKKATGTWHLRTLHQTLVSLGPDVQFQTLTWKQT